MHLNDMAKEVWEVNEANGWHDIRRTFGEEIALIHTEPSEALEAYRKWGLEDATEPSFGSKPEGVGSELADTIIRVLDTASRYNFDIFHEYQRKLAYNRTRSYRHGGKRL